MLFWPVTVHLRHCELQAKWLSVLVGPSVKRRTPSSSGCCCCSHAGTLWVDRGLSSLAFKNDHFRPSSSTSGIVTKKSVAIENSIHVPTFRKNRAFQVILRSLSSKCPCACHQRRAPAHHTEPQASATAKTSNAADIVRLLDRPFLRDKSWSAWLAVGSHTTITTQTRFPNCSFLCFPGF